LSPKSLPAPITAQFTPIYTMSHSHRSSPTRSSQSQRSLPLMTRPTHIVRVSYSCTQSPRAVAPVTWLPQATRSQTGASTRRRARPHLRVSVGRRRTPGGDRKPWVSNRKPWVSNCKPWRRRRSLARRERATRPQVQRARLRRPPLGSAGFRI
jgi:hypothetical protein